MVVLFLLLTSCAFIGIFYAASRQSDFVKVCELRGDRCSHSVDLSRQNVATGTRWQGEGRASLSAFHLRRGPLAITPVGPQLLCVVFSRATLERLVTNVEARLRSCRCPNNNEKPATLPNFINIHTAACHCTQLPANTATSRSDVSTTQRRLDIEVTAQHDWSIDNADAAL